MADTTPQPYKFDEAAFAAKIDTIKKYQLDFSGKPNHNPHIWLHKNVTPLLQRYEGGERSKELFDAANSLKQEAPIIDANWQPEVPETPQQALRAQGLKNFGSKNIK